MNEKLVGWFEDILPQIKETNDVRGTMLKFANEKNMAPALLENSVMFITQQRQLPISTSVPVRIKVGVRLSMSWIFLV